MPSQPNLQRVASALADTFLAGEFDAARMAGRAAGHFDKSWRGLGPLCLGLVEAFGPSTRPARRDLIRAIRRDPGLKRWLLAGGLAQFTVQIGTRPRMRSAKGEPATWDLPAITSPCGLARWLDLTEPELRWFARPWRGSGERLQHYQHHWLPKRRGGHRLIEKPKAALKLIQRRILNRILSHIPPHDSVHSYRIGRNVISYAQPHCARPILLRLDIADFFPSLHIGRVRSLFRTSGYPDAVANLLADLCCHAPPTAVLTNTPTPLSWSQRKRLRSPHLPQGAPTSPALSNLLGYRLDCRLAGLAAALGASYTRYADDLAFSGDRRIAKAAPLIGAILVEQGFTPNHRKSRLQRGGTRQCLGGTIVNSQRPNIPRRDYDQLKATLYNCTTRGPLAEDHQGLGAEAFRAQLQGKISWVRSLNPHRAAKLDALFGRIRW